LNNVELLRTFMMKKFTVSDLCKKNSLAEPATRLLNAGCHARSPRGRLDLRELVEG